MFDFGNRAGIKICGVTDRRDALVCAGAGADMIGLNFSPQSRRCISLADAAEIVAAVRSRLPQVRFVGVFVNQAVEEVRTIAADLALDAVQLHGAESPEYLKKFPAPFVIKTLRVGTDGSGVNPSDYTSDAVLLDTWSAAAAGGTGETFPWEFAIALRPRIHRLILAGGLTSENVREAIRMVKPFAVDVCSGVEKAPGHKDEARVRSFVAAVRAIEKEVAG